MKPFYRRLHNGPDSGPVPHVLNIHTVLGEVPHVGVVLVVPLLHQGAHLHPQSVPGVLLLVEREGTGAELELDELLVSQPASLYPLLASDISESVRPLERP